MPPKCAVGLLALLGLAHVGQPPPAQLETIAVDDPRPLDAAIQILQDRFGYVMTYEDPRFTNAGDVVDITDRVRRSGAPTTGRRTLGPRGGRLDFDYMPRAGRDRNAILAVLERLVANYNASSHPGAFRVTQADELFHVVPVTVRARDGRVINQPSILDTRISVPFERGRSVYMMLNEIGAALGSASGHKVVLGMIPINLVAQARMEGGATNEVARVVLARTLRATRARLSWRLYYDPSGGLYFLNLGRVEPAFRELPK